MNINTHFIFKKSNKISVSIDLIRHETFNKPIKLRRRACADCNEGQLLSCISTIFSQFLNEFSKFKKRLAHCILTPQNMHITC